MGSRSAAIIATLDTKEDEARFLKDWLESRGCPARLMDVGTLQDPRSPLRAPDVPRDRIAMAAGLSVAALATLRRDEAMAAMGRGAGALLRGWVRDDTLSGVIGIGGHQGTAIGSLAMRTLPSSLPRVLVSTVASGNVRPFLGYSDIAIVSSVGDLLGGPNRVTRPILTRAAAMLLGMIEAAGPLPSPSSGASPEGRATSGAAAPGAERGSAGPTPGNAAEAAGPAVAVTALGNTHAAVLRVMQDLRERGYEVVPFHASGPGGSAMEALVEEGAFEAVIDLTPHELVGEVLGDDIYAPMRPRLTAAGEAGVPQVVAPGGLDYFVFGAPETVPDRYRGRATHHHNPYNTNVRATADELHRLGEALAERLNGARGPVAFLCPQRGWSYIGREGGPLWDPEANDALRRVVRRALRQEIRYIEVDAGINDPQFADEVAAVAGEFLAARGEPAGPRRHLGRGRSDGVASRLTP